MGGGSIRQGDDVNKRGRVGGKVQNIWTGKAGLFLWDIM